MNPLYGLMLFGIAFFGFMVVVGVVQARRKKEKAYYISAIVSFLMLLFSIFIILNQFILALILFIAIPILSIAGLPKIIKVMKREPLKELQETDFSAPLRVRELLTWKGWFKPKSRWGIRKTMCLYSLLNMWGYWSNSLHFKHLRLDKHGIDCCCHNPCRNILPYLFLLSNREKPWSRQKRNIGRVTPMTFHMLDL